MNEKYDLMATESELLMLQIGNIGVSIGDDRKRVVAEWPRSMEIIELCIFLGLLQFFQRF